MRRLTPPPHQDPMKNRGNLTVLILDDERFDRHRMARLCSGLPATCEITNAASLEAFDAELDARVYDLILVDYQLPDGTGLEALDAVHRSVRNFNSATIMITGQADGTIAKTALRAGCTDYLTKDELTLATFQRAVNNALQKSALTLQVELQTFARAEVEAVLEVFASHFAGDIKPLISRLLRQVRDLRARPDADQISAIEGSCMNMWEALIELERHTGGEMMALTLLDAQAATPKQTNKPPSPFARVRQ